MDAPDIPVVTLADARLVPELLIVAERLLNDTEHDFTIHYHRDDSRKDGLTWLIVERDGNVGTIQYERIDGYKVAFAIQPSAETGSSLLVSVPGTERDPRDADEATACAVVATGEQYRNFATSTALSNHGWRHFDWAKQNLVRVIMDESSISSS